MNKFRTMLRAALFITLTLALTACAAVAPAAPAPAEPQAAAEPPAEGLEDLVAAAQAEGMLSTIALPRDWCNYGEAIDSFSEKYGIRANELDPNAASGDELEAVRANKDNKGPQAPDVIDVGHAFGPLAQEEG